MLFILPAAVVAPEDPDRQGATNRLRLIVADALKHSGVSPKAAAIAMRLVFPQFSADLASGRIHGWRLFLLPPKTLAWIAVLLAKEYGVPEECAAGMKLATAANGKKRMARARTEPVELKEKAG
jgi:hypothetical protein